MAVRNVWGASKIAYFASFNAVLATCMQPLALEDLLCRNDIVDCTILGCSLINVIR